MINPIFPIYRSFKVAMTLVAMPAFYIMHNNMRALNADLRDTNFLHSVSRWGWATAAELLLWTGKFDPNQRDAWFGQTPLDHAIACDRLETAQVLLRHGARHGKLGEPPRSDRMAKILAGALSQNFNNSIG